MRSTRTRPAVRRLEPVRCSRGARRTPGRRRRCECAAARRRQRHGRDGRSVPATAESQWLRAALDRVRPDCGGPRPRRCLVRRPADRLSVGSGTGKHLSRGPGTGPVVHCTGFKAIMDLTFGPTGASMSSRMRPAHSQRLLHSLRSSGRLSRVAPNCTVTPLLAGLNRPTAVAVGADGAIYVTNNGVTAGAGEVLRIAP